MQWARAEMASLRNTLPGQMTRMGGLRVSMVLTCTELVCVRRRTGLTPEEGLEDMVVVLDLRSFGESVALLAEDGDNLLAGDGYGMAGAQLEVVARHGHVEGGSGAFCRLGAPAAELLDLGRGHILEIVQFLAVFPLLVRRYGAEFVEKLGDLSLLAEQMDTELLDFLFCLCLCILNFRQDALDFLVDHIIELIELFPFNCLS